MLIHRTFLAPFVWGALLLSSARAFAQNPPPTAAPVATPAAVPVAAPKTAAEVPGWIPAAAILGALLGLSGLGLAGFMFFQKNLEKERLQNVQLKNLELEKKVVSLEASVVRVNTLEDSLCRMLREKYNPNDTPGFSLQNALNNIAGKQTHGYFAKEVDPRLNSAEQVMTKTRDDLKGFVAHVNAREGEVRSTLAAHDARAGELTRGFQSLDARTRGELEAFAFNIYNLLFTQSEGDPMLPRLENRVQKLETMLGELHRVQPDEVTRLTMREFEETLDKLAQKLRDARGVLARARGAEVEPLLYLEEKDKSRAPALLEEQRKKMRGQTADARESLDALRDAAIELSKPLQTLWMGASIPDPDKPERNERCRVLLSQVKVVLAGAGIGIYEPQIGGELDPDKANYRFTGDSHDAPFIVQKVTKLGLEFEGRAEKGAVVVA